MAEVSIRFRHNPKTGKRELLIEYESEADLLPHEHERDHRALAEKLIGQPLGDDVEITVERAKKEAQRNGPTQEPAPSQKEKQGQSGGG